MVIFIKRGNMEIYQQIGKQVKAIRKKAGYTQERLAESAGLSLNYIHMIESGKRAPTVDTLNKIAGCLKVKLKDLFSTDLPAPVLEKQKTIELTSEEYKQLLTTIKTLKKKTPKNL
ncbi:TPA: hypothetical protein DCG35_01990 [Candidatus Edwardsbacteria bacterium]|nr:hypothetical protein [Candidatus Edwardsbacteria bacterium]